MDFKTTTETILKWVRSCDTLEQMSLCSEAIDTFVIDRFSGKVDVEEFAKGVFELHGAMSEREVQIVSKNVVILPALLTIHNNLN